MRHQNRFPVAEKFLKQLSHDAYHAQKLLDKYHDLHISVEEDRPVYYSEIINPETDQCTFTKEMIKYEEWDIHYMDVYKVVQIDCPDCDGNLSVFGLPEQIQLMITKATQSDLRLYGFDYADCIKEHKYSNNIVALADLHIIKLINELSLNQWRSVDLYAISSRIKKLLPFS